MKYLFCHICGSIQFGINKIRLQFDSTYFKVFYSSFNPITRERPHDLYKLSLYFISIMVLFIESLCFKQPMECVLNLDEAQLFEVTRVFPYTLRE